MQARKKTFVSCKAMSMKAGRGSCEEPGPVSALKGGLAEEPALVSDDNPHGERSGIYGEIPAETGAC